MDTKVGRRRFLFDAEELFRVLVGAEKIVMRDGTTLAISGLGDEPEFSGVHIDNSRDCVVFTGTAPHYIPHFPGNAIPLYEVSFRELSSSS